MTGMLASVTGPAEALQAVSAGVDLVDLKDPTAGALAALPTEVVAAAVDAVGGRLPVSAAAGDLLPLPRLVVPAVRRIWQTGVDYVKIGMLDATRWAPRLGELRGALPEHASLIGVLFADQPHEFSIIEALAAAGFAGVMLDTAGKSGPGLRGHLNDARLRGFVRRARAAGLLSGLAGSLRVGDIKPLLAAEPDYLGFRGALCRRGQRSGGLDPSALRAVRERLRAPLAGATAAASRRRAGSPAATRQAARS